MPDIVPPDIASIDRGSCWPMRGVIAAAVLIAFGISVGHGFVGWDDQELITGNRNFNPATLASLAHHWRAPDHQMYIPVVYSVWWVLAHVPGADAVNRLSPIAFHAANVIVHLISSLFVFQILYELVGKKWASCVGALLFAVHPLQAEPVAWATGMKDVLSGALALATVWQYVLARRDDSLRRYLIASALFVLALLAKPSTVVLPVICAVIDFLLLRRPLKQIAVWLAPWIVPAAICVWIAAKVQPIPASLITPLWQRPLIAADSLSWYLMKLIYPYGLAIDYSRTPAQVMHSGWLQYNCLGLAVFVAVLSQFRKRVYLAASLIFIAALLPVLGFTPFAFQRYSTVADRYAYLAMLGPALATAAGLSLAATRKWAIPSAVVIAVLAALSFRQMRVWRDTLTLFNHTLAVNPTSLAATRSLGFYWASHGDDARAAAYYEAANRAHPDDPSNHFNYANLLKRNGALGRALEHYQRAVALDPSNVSFHLNFGVALAIAEQRSSGTGGLQRE